jgi:putative SOS response-associated peptidase YedK
MLAAHFQALSDDMRAIANDVPLDLAPSYNIAPTQSIVVVLENGHRTLRQMKWGLVPRWAGPGRPVKPLVNARAETLLEKPSFREAANRRRCIVPASGFYEWRKVGRERMPCYITRRDGQPMSFAGIWEPSPNGSVETCSIVTVPANPLLASLHERMPAILQLGQEEGWLDVGHVDGLTAAAALRSAPEEWLDMQEVSPRMNRQAVNDPECIASAPHESHQESASRASEESLSLFGADW